MVSLPRDTDELADVTFLRHEACPDCGSSDALAVYDDGHTYCFSCQTYTDPNKESHSSYDGDLLRGYPVQLRKRGLSEQTCRKYRIHKDGDKLRFHYFDRNGSLLGAKVKTVDKQFHYEGKSDGSLYGQHLFPTTGRRIVITEGELDAASCFQAMEGWPMVSLPTGAASAKKSLQKNLELLQGYEEVVLFFDNDEPGKKAAQECASILPPGKAKIAFLDEYKDASDALQNNDSEAIRRAIWDAREYRPDGIVEGKHSYNLSLPQDHQQTSTMDLKGSTTYYMAHDTESLSQLLQAAAQGSPHSAGTLRLSYYRMETGSVTWLLKNQTAELP